MTYAEVSLDVAGAAAVLTLRRPAGLNAFTHPMLAEIEDAVRRSVANRDVVGVVITGEGRGFCAGLDATVLSKTADTGSSGRPRIATDELHGLFSYLLEQ